MLGKEPYHEFGHYEDVGNYIYTISEREIEKAALGVNFPMVSFKTLNDHYIDGVEFETKNEQAPLYNQIVKAISQSDKKTQQGLQWGGLLVTIIHKTMPENETMKKLEGEGFVNRKLPRNPYQ
jgi:hypothetical protein